MELILEGAHALFQPQSFAWLVAGVVLGFVVGAIPGLGSANAAALMLPFAIGLPTSDALVLIGGMYAGCMFAGAIPAILINAPGEPGAAATALDGHPMAMQGKAERAIGIARMASVVGGLISGLAVLLIIGPLGKLALAFGAREILVIALIGITVIAIVVGDSPRKGLISGLIGLLIAAMAANPYTGEPRFTLGFIELYSEVPFVPVIIGLFGVAEMLLMASRKTVVRTPQASDLGGSKKAAAAVRHSFGEALRGTRIALKYPVTLVRSAVIGLVIGIVPGVGSSVSNFISYGVAKRSSKNKDNFGKGEPEGIVASEACDNAVASGALIPTLALGIPGSATMVVVLAALYLHGIQPGPNLLATEGKLVYTLVWAAVFSSVLILPLGILLASPLAVVAKIRPVFLVPSVILLCALGTYSVRTSFFDVWLMLIFGVVGALMRKKDYPVVPLVLGLVLGPIAEENLLRGLQLGNNSMSYFFQSPIANGLWVVLLLLIISSIKSSIERSRDARKQAKQEPVSAA